MKFRILIAMLMVTSVFTTTAIAEDTAYKPFVLASVNDGTLEDSTSATVKALRGAGFEIAGQYSPVDGSNVIVGHRVNGQSLM